MGKRNKFENVDVLASLEAILKQNTGFYQSDFDIDKQIIAEKAASPSKEDKTLLWLSRPSGTYCFRERDVFISDTAPHNTWRYYKEQSRDPILASLGAMLLISAFIIAISKTPGEAKTKQKKNNISLRPAQRERIKTNRY